jgi:hypothetical protein
MGHVLPVRSGASPAPDGQDERDLGGDRPRAHLDRAAREALDVRRERRSGRALPAEEARHAALRDAQPDREVLLCPALPS